MRLITLSGVLSLLLLGCGDASTPGAGAGGAGGAAGGAGTGTGGVAGGGDVAAFKASLSHSFDPIDIGVGEEIADLCQSWVLGNEETLYVNKIRQDNGGGWHHSNWFFVPEAVYPPNLEAEGPDATLEGTWRCRDRGFREFLAAAAGGVFFAQSTQTLEEVQAFPPGAVLEISPHSVIVGDTHLLNISAAPMSSAMTMAVETIPAEDVQVLLTPFSFSNTSLDIPPQKESRFSMTCDLRPAFQGLLGADPDYKVYYVLAHYHQWGNFFNLSFAYEDGRRNTILELRNRIGEPIGKTIDPPMSNDGAMGLQVDCGYINNTDNTLTYGLGGHEMCVFLAYTNSNLKVGIGAGGNHVMGEDENGIVLNETDCGDVTAFRAYSE